MGSPDDNGYNHTDEKRTKESATEAAEDRGHWGHKMDFMLSCIGYAVGLGNVWRFPYLCASSGGGAFLIPYCIMLVLVGIPLFILELTIGQYTQEGPLQVWENLFPVLKGVGYAMCVCSFGVAIYYNVIIAWCYYFVFASMQDPLPWSKCNQTWNDAKCYERVRICDSNDSVTTVATTVAATVTGAAKQVIPCVSNTTKVETPSEQYWNHHVLEISNGIGELGTVRWHLALCLLLAWIVIYFCVFKGVKSSGKVVYFTATFPYVVLVILLIRGVTLEGHLDGIRFYLTPDWSKLSDAKVWADATTQIFFSLSVGFGGLITMASYNQFYNNCFRDSITVALINCSTSFFAGFVIFSVVGYMAHTAGRPVAEVADQGVSLAFIVYPAAVAAMPVSQLWSIIFFFMLITLGMDSQFAFMETIITAAVDEYPKQLREKKWFICIIGCGFLYLLGFPCICQGGAYVVQLLDDYVAGISLLFLVICECIACGWGYGNGRIGRDLKRMIGYQPWFYHWFLFCWKYISPATLMFVVVFKFVDYGPIKYGTYIFPKWSEIIAWFVALCSMLCIPGVAIYKIVKAPGDTFAEKWRVVSTPRDDKYGDLMESAMELKSREMDNVA
ncbi:uncharacterized protein TRIADDRAFT_64302 [Trichoplax adhaerens]|uniref:Transporter n=1 Tax=Trichoplax adhaerens TaxID=10228 RepID=B3S9D7_TRIAD|nr:hypothetical protein TRIADDRAFT_64302 [Trichoplax adhaerens]EDV20630.1 hypothetical protein TRIADDRAFT_64302 [Trichoplax adhaerens]|eukprot:XP_002116830.1 hypothetical protein TRIADDRAFT_64302 [Trichoplax adhaerens]